MAVYVAVDSWLAANVSHDLLTDCALCLKAPVRSAYQ